MKAIKINFFSPTENDQPKPKARKATKPTKLVLTGYISSTGKLVLPAKTVASLGIDLNDTSFKLGIDQGKRKAKSLYLVPASSDAQTFSFDKAAKSYVLAVPFILAKSGVDYDKARYSFTIRLFDYEGTTAFELRLNPESTEAKVPYAGKPRGRKPKQDQVAN